MVGDFGNVGSPDTLIQAVIDHGATNRGDLANRHAGVRDAVAAAGSAMDFVISAKWVAVVMDLLTKTGEYKLVERCLYSLTGLACMSRVYTNVAIFTGAPGARSSEMIDGMSLAKLRDMARLNLEIAADATPAGGRR